MQRDQTGLGIALILASVTAMAFGDAIIKKVSGDLTLWQILLIRSVVATPFLIGFLRFTKSLSELKSVRWVWARSGLLILTWLTYYASLPSLDLSIAAIALYTNPILITLMSAFLLRERVSAVQWLGVFTGFVGITVILQPWNSTVAPIVILPFLGALFYAMAMVLTRAKCQDENPAMLALHLHKCFIGIGGFGVAVLLLFPVPEAVQSTAPFLLKSWQIMTPTSWLILILLGILSAGFFLGVAKSYQIAPPQIIATFDYGYLVSATLWAVVLFAETPSLSTWIGMGLIIIAGLMATRSAKV